MDLRQAAARGRRRALGRMERLKIEKIIRASVLENASAGAFLGLTRFSLMLTSLDSARSQRPSVNLVLPAISASGLFAGVRTAIEVGVEISRIFGLKLRLISFEGPHSKGDIVALERLMEEEFHMGKNEWGVVPATDIHIFSAHDDDVWIATYWTTAHALDVRSRLGLLNPNNVIYLIQDYEPSFLPASTDAAIAASTYHAGFVTLVNSAPLASALLRHAGIRVDKNQVFAPQLDIERLQRVSTQRVLQSSSPEILFYGRPSKPRNMFNLGVATLRRVIQSSDLAQGWTITSIGEKHEAVSLGSGRRLRSLGALSWSEYFERIAGASVMLSLQASPHPSHPPLDMVVSGGLAVTNEVDHTRENLHKNLAVAEADPDALAIKLEAQMDTSLNSTLCPVFDSEFMSKLGVPMSNAVEAAVKNLYAQ